MLADFGAGNVFSTIAVFYSKMAVVTFGGAYAVLAYMAQQAVKHYHWLKPDEMLVGLGFAETTPGPLIWWCSSWASWRRSVRRAHAPALAGILGGVLAMWLTFVPSFLWIFLGAPYIEALLGNRRLTAALSAITAAVVGVILNLAVWFAIHTMFRATRHIGGFGLIFDAPDPGERRLLALSCSPLGAAIAIFRFKAGMIPTLRACSLQESPFTPSAS